ncbi:parallel beta-helix repeat-containing protein [Zhouia amylolytica]|uniref:Parallel beta-helix repeat-containing protein n=1 Tax=Zhouia amylolytica TaxID=376730 RepID=A0A1I6S4V2_9FLAO|nr:parallel beta-helix domain-containing protein [Zhouia amylolytica]MCQ0111018.1 right-handed parallel beta-helix repeat-containing protein [Zhouia amylolytica]SFS71966.1 parallel beta-helix repeat-containing protein [Zhouia amylolytica]
MKKRSVLLKTIGAFAFLLIGLFLGRMIFKPKKVETVPIPSTMQYWNTGASKDTSAVAQAANFTGNIIKVEDGGSIREAVLKAQPGDLIRVYPGTYSETVYIDKDNIGIQGVIVDGKWPVMDGKKELNDAILYSGNGITIENLKIIKYKGNGIMGQAGNNFVIRNNWIIDTGVYGIFPQYGKNGIVEYNILTEIEDAAIYVGMCDNVDVKYNEVFGNVAGIEIENSRHCLVESNYAHNNTGGILAFLTPGLPIKTIFDVIIRNNFVIGNNHENFGAPGSIVSGIPKGTGVLIMAADDVIVENNIIANNDNAGITIVDLATGAPTANDPNSEPNPDRVVILDNFMIENGNNPVGEIKALMMSQLKTKGPDILAMGGGTGSSIRDKNRYRTFGLGNYGTAEITDTKDITTFTFKEPVAPRSVSKEELGELTYYGVCAGCHAFDTRLIGVPTNIIQAVYEGNPQGIVDYINKPWNLRDDYPDMPSQAYLPEDAKMAVAEYILSLKK